MRFFWSAVALVGLTIGLAGINGVSQTAPAPATPAGEANRSPLPDGPGKEVVGRMCVGCHNLKTITSKRATPEEWARIVDLMISRGAEGSDEDADTVVKYLSAHFGPATNQPATATEPSTSPQLIFNTRRSQY